MSIHNMFSWRNKKNIYLGPDVQSVVSLTSLLRVILLIVLADSIYNILICFVEKMHRKSYSQGSSWLRNFFQQNVTFACLLNFYWISPNKKFVLHKY